MNSRLSCHEYLIDKYKNIINNYIGIFFDLFV